jgi:hypothetical protein
MPAMLPATNPAAMPPKSIHKMYLSFAPTYRHMISPTIPRIISVPRSGMSKKTKKRMALMVMNEMKKLLSLILLRFLNNHDHKNNTYPNLKNSAGWILGRKGILIHHLAPLSVIPIPGTKTANCNTIKMTDIMMIFLSFWKNLRETIYTSHDITNANQIFLNCLKK